MSDIIETLRKKPVQYRKRILFFTSTFITGVIVLVWLSTFNFFPEISDEDSIAVDQQLRPVDDLKKSFIGFIDTLKVAKDGMFSNTASSTKSNDE